MLQPTAPGQETIRPPSPVSGGDESVQLKFEIRARRKDEEDWIVVARLRLEDDAKAALWAIVFTGQYAAVTVRCEGVAALVAEWPAGLSGLR